MVSHKNGSLRTQGQRRQFSTKFSHFAKAVFHKILQDLLTLPIFQLITFLPLLIFYEFYILQEIV